ncbi:MAG: glycosyltransferase [Beijerinckiaceae bacterium]
MSLWFSEHGGKPSRSPIAPSPVAQTAIARQAPAAHALRARQQYQLPEAIAFLASYGVAPGVLLEAVARAAADGVRAEAALLAGGGVSAGFYYRALARHLGLPFIDGAAALAPGAGFPVSLTAGFAPLDNDSEPGPAWLFAPAGKRLDELLQLKRRGTLPRDRFAIAAPEHLRDLVFERGGAGIADASANMVANWRPDLSAKHPATAAQKLALLFLFGLFGFGVIAGGNLWLAISLLSGFVLSGAIVVRLFAAAGSCDASAFVPAPPIADRDLPVFTIVVALYKEVAVAASLAAALGRLDYPHAKLDIIFVVEADDDETRAAFLALKLPARFQILTAPDGKPRTKPRALNVALPLARGEYICVYDAEDLPEPGQLREAAALFAQQGESVACVQGRLAIDNHGDSWLTRMFALEYAALFDVVNPGLAWLGMPIPLGGTSNHFRGIRQQRHQA